MFSIPFSTGRDRGVDTFTMFPACQSYFFPRDRPQPQQIHVSSFQCSCTGSKTDSCSDPTTLRGQTLCLWGFASSPHSIGGIEAEPKDFSWRIWGFLQTERDETST